VYLAHMGEPAFRKAMSIARTLRHKGIACYLEAAEGSLKSQLRQANRVHAENVLIVGEDELARGRYLLKRMRDSMQREVSLEELEHYLGGEDAAGE
jgi:histidyl-tRNA synthetase